MHIAAPLPASPSWCEPWSRGTDCLARQVTRAALICLLSSGGILLASEDGPSDDGVPATDIRRELLSEFKYAPAKKAPDSPASVGPMPKAQPRLDPSPAAGADTVRMAPFEVQDSRTPLNLSTWVVQEEPTTPAETMASKLGIGVHTWKMGKTRLNVRTIFYIPFLVGLEW
jgi:hypothetical protein